MNGKKIEDQTISDLLELANWAPTHARTEPWRFIVYGGQAVGSFCTAHAELYKKDTPEDKFTTAKYDNLVHMGDQASHIIAVYMNRQEPAKIPVMEEIAATAAAVQNILLGAEAVGIASFWSTGGMVLQPIMKQFLKLSDEDIVMGLLYLGYTDEPAPPAKRNTTIETKVTWNR